VALIRRSMAGHFRLDLIDFFSIFQAQVIVINAAKWVNFFLGVGIGVQGLTSRFPRICMS
jgi:hypothetical protein